MDITQTPSAAALPRFDGGALGTEASTPSAVPAPWRLTLLFDGDCPLCLREVSWLRRRDRCGQLVFQDITSPRFDPAAHGATAEQLMAAMHAVRPDGSLLVGADVFREAYRVVGLGWLVAPTRWPGLRQLTDAAYRLFARYRVRIGNLFGRRCDDGSCALPRATESPRTRP